MDISVEVIAIVAEVAEIPASNVSFNSDLRDDLGIDSMMALEIMALIDQRWKVFIPEDELENIRTVNDLLTRINEMM